MSFTLSSIDVRASNGLAVSKDGGPVLGYVRWGTRNGETHYLWSETNAPATDRSAWRSIGLASAFPSIGHAVRAYCEPAPVATEPAPRADSPILQRLAEANAALEAEGAAMDARGEDRFAFRPKWNRLFDTRESLQAMAVKADPVAYVRAYPSHAMAYRHLLPADMVARIEAAETDADMIAAVAPAMVPQPAQQQQGRDLRGVIHIRDLGDIATPEHDTYTRAEMEAARAVMVARNLRVDNRTGTVRDDRLGELSRFSNPSDHVPHASLDDVMRWAFRPMIANSASRVARGFEP